MTQNFGLTSLWVKASWCFQGADSRKLGQGGSRGFGVKFVSPDVWGEEIKSWN